MRTPSVSPSCAASCCADLPEASTVPDGGHDHVANAVAGALVVALGRSEPVLLTWYRLEVERLRAAGAVA